MLGRIVGGGEDRIRPALRHVIAAVPCADEDQLANQVGRLQRDLLGNKAADRDAEHVDLGQAQRPDEGDGVRAHLLEAGRRLARRIRHAGIVEQDHLAVLGEAVGHGRIPIIHRARIVLVEDERDAALLAEAAKGEADSVGLDVLRWGGVVGGGHLESFPGMASARR